MRMRYESSVNSASCQSGTSVIFSFLRLILFFWIVDLTVWMYAKWFWKPNLFCLLIFPFCPFWELVASFNYSVFCTQESLAFMFEMAHLHEDALREYDELELCYLETGAWCIVFFSVAVVVKTMVVSILRYIRVVSWNETKTKAIDTYLWHFSFCAMNRRCILRIGPVSHVSRLFTESQDSVSAIF